MTRDIPKATIDTLARSIFKEASTYGFQQLDIIRLINQLMDLCTSSDSSSTAVVEAAAKHALTGTSTLSQLPIRGERIIIRDFNIESDETLLERWLPDKYGRFFMLSSMTAQSSTIAVLTSNPSNHVGIITLLDGTPIGAMAMLDHSRSQKRAELRKLIGNADYRGKGIAEEATRLWIQYGIQGLGLEKIYVSTLQTQIANIKLNENIGFQVEGLLRNEVLIDGRRFDVLRMGLSTVND